LFRAFLEGSQAVSDCYIKANVAARARAEPEDIVTPGPAAVRRRKYRNARMGPESQSEIIF
jgi:hypothetical protein